MFIAQWKYNYETLSTQQSLNRKELFTLGIQVIECHCTENVQVLISAPPPKKTKKNHSSMWQVFVATYLPFFISNS